MATLVLLPGLDGTGELFEPLLDAFGADLKVRVVRYPTQEALGYAELEGFAKAAFPADDDFAILGESFSGPLAVSLAASPPRNLRALILCCSFVSNPRPALAVLEPLVSFLPLEAIPLGVIARALMGRFATPALRETLRRALAQVAPAVLRARIRAVLKADASLALAAATLPVGYLRAAKDRVVPGSAAKRVTDLCPRARIVEIDGPHFLLQTAPRASAVAIRDFMLDAGIAF